MAGLHSAVANLCSMESISRACVWNRRFSFVLTIPLLSSALLFRAPDHTADSAKNADIATLKSLYQNLDKAKSTGNGLSEVDAYTRLANYFIDRGETREALEHLNAALKIADKNKATDRMIELYSAIGDAYKTLGIYQKALDAYLKAVRLTEEKSDAIGSARIFNSIGTVYQRTSDFNDALDYFGRAKAINEAHHLQEAVLSNMLNIAVIQQKRSELEDALSTYFKILPMAREMNQRMSEAIILGNIGSTMTSQGKLEEGLVYLKRALEIKEEIRNFRSTMHTLNDIAEVTLKLGDAQGAIDAAQRVVRLGTAYEVADQLRFGYLNLAKGYRMAKDHERAYLFLEKYNHLSDSLFGIEKAQQINALEIAYDTERKDMAIHNLEQEKKIAQARRKNYFMAGAVIFVVLVVLYVNQRLKTKRNRELLEKEREVDRLKSDFFANISHEFRTPLSLILGPIDTMLARMKAGEHQLQLELMKRNASRLLRMINQILELSRLQFGRPRLVVEKCDAVQMISGITSTFQSMAEVKGIQLSVVCDEPEIPLYCNRENIETVCVNLISNAFKFTDTGESISVVLASDTPLNRKYLQGALALRVIDHGIGIAADDVAHIFDRYYRAGSAAEKRYGGTGIGLALTKELVELHGGDISVSSEVGKGTVVTVMLPLGKAHLKEDQIVADTDTPLLVDRPSLQMETTGSPAGETVKHPDGDAGEKPIVLLLDDNEDVRGYVRSILDGTYTLLEAPNGEEGLRQARAFIPDLIVSDVMMPVMNGYEVCRQVRRDEKTSHIPVILLTAKASLDSRIEGLETEADLYLNKPFVPRELLLCIHNLIASRRKLRERYNRQVVLKPVDIAINSTDEIFLERLMKTLEENYADEDFGVEQLSEAIGMSRSQLHRKLHALTNESCSQFIRSFRLQRAMALLKANHASISEIAYMVGFSSPPYFNRCFLQQYGCTPSSVTAEAVAELPHPKSLS